MLIKVTSFIISGFITAFSVIKLENTTGVSLKIFELKILLNGPPSFKKCRRVLGTKMRKMLISNAYDFPIIPDNSDFNRNLSDL